MNGRFFAVGVIGAVLGIGYLSSTLLSQTFNVDTAAPAEQAGSVFAGDDPAEVRGAVPDPLPIHRDNVDRPRGHDPVEQQARSLHAQLKQRVADTDAASPRDLQLKAALDRYFANSQIDQAVRILEAVVKATPNTPEANRAEAAIQMLRSGEGAEPIMPRAGTPPLPQRAAPRTFTEPTRDATRPAPAKPAAAPVNDPFAEPTAPGASVLPKRVRART